MALEKDRPGSMPTSEENSSGDEHHGIVKTQTNVSIAETLSLPHEIVFVAVICLAQLFTRECETVLSEANRGETPS